MPALTLSGLVVYPIKSAGGIPAETWEVDDFGLRHDRRWMVVDGRGRMVTQRTYPRLALARPAIEGERLVVRGGDQDLLVLPLRPAPAASSTVTIWGDHCAALWQGEVAARWFSTLLRAEVSLVYMPETTWRPVDPHACLRAVPGQLRRRVPVSAALRGVAGRAQPPDGHAAADEPLSPQPGDPGGRPFCEDDAGRLRHRRHRTFAR